MLTLTQSLSIRGATGDPLPVVWASLGARGAMFRRGQLALIASGPGTGKSALALSYALKSKVATLYFSADSDPSVQISRALSITKAMTMAKARQEVSEQNTALVREVLGAAPIRFSFEPRPTLTHIETEVLAYQELYGAYPELIVIDNALDVAIDNTEDGYRNLDALMAWLHDLARQTQSCVICLHHVTGGFNDANRPIPLSGVKGQISRVPELILTLHKQDDALGDDDMLCVSVVKNRGHRANASGEDFIPLTFDGEHMQIYEEEYEWVNG